MYPQLILLSPIVEMDDGTILNEIIIDEPVSEQATKGNLPYSFEEWKSVIRMEGGHI